MKKTIPEILQQNDVTERMNRTLIEYTRSMRLHVELPKMFWVEAVNITTYMIYKGPSTLLNYKTQEEVWSGK